MPDRKIRKEVEDLQTIQNLVQTYEEIAAGRIQKVKVSVLTNREFLGVLGDIFAQVKYYFDKKQSEKKEKSILKTKKKAIVLLSANTGLYGGLVRKTFNLFIERVKDTDADVVIVGRLGRGLYESIREEKGLRDYKYFDLPDTPVEIEVINEVSTYIINYDEVTVFRGKFESLISQAPVADELTGQLDLTIDKRGEEIKFIFEPSVEQIMTFFESEIMAAIFEQAIHESNLSKYAARMINLDRSVANINESLKDLIIEGRRSKHRIFNKKQANALTGISLWNK